MFCEDTTRSREIRLRVEHGGKTAGVPDLIPTGGKVFSRAEETFSKADGGMRVCALEKFGDLLRYEKGLQETQRVDKDGIALRAARLD